MAGSKKKPGRPRKYPKELANDGAPILTVRLDPDVFLHITSQKEGRRAYIERLVRKDVEGAEPT